MMFRDQVGIVAGWFRGWSECEQTVALLALLKRVSRTQARFLQLCLEHSLADCPDIHLLEAEANSAAAISQWPQEPAEAAVALLLAHLPLLQPGNAAAKAEYMKRLQKVLADAIESNRCVEESRQLLSYALIHPATTADDRSALALWLGHLEERLAPPGHAQPRRGPAHEWPPEPPEPGGGGRRRRAVPAPAQPPEAPPAAGARPGRGLGGSRGAARRPPGAAPVRGARPPVPPEQRGLVGQRAPRGEPRDPRRRRQELLPGGRQRHEGCPLVAEEPAAAQVRRALRPDELRGDDDPDRETPGDTECHQGRAAQDRPEHPKAAGAAERPQGAGEGHPGGREPLVGAGGAAADLGHAHQGVPAAPGHAPRQPRPPRPRPRRRDPRGSCPRRRHPGTVHPGHGKGVHPAPGVAAGRGEHHQLPPAAREVPEP